MARVPQSTPDPRRGGGKWTRAKFAIVAVTVLVILVFLILDLER